MYPALHSSLVVLLVWIATAAERTGGTRGFSRSMTENPGVGLAGLSAVKLDDNDSYGDDNNDNGGSSPYSLIDDNGSDQNLGISQYSLGSNVAQGAGRGGGSGQTTGQGLPNLDGVLQGFLNQFETEFQTVNQGGGGFGNGGKREGLDVGNWKKYLTNITCPAGSPDTLPPCVSAPSLFPGSGVGQGAGRRRKENATGTWICRTLYNPITGQPSTSTRCINPRSALITDTCGCCQPDGCPKACTCPCRNGTGVLVNVMKKKDNQGDGMLVQMCLRPEVAVTVIATVKNVTCATTCKN